MPTIRMENFLTFSANTGVCLDAQAVLNMVKDGRVCDLADGIELAQKYVTNRHLVDADCGAMGPLAEYETLDFDEFLEKLDQIAGRENQIALNARVKDAATRYRRSQFAYLRADLVLALLDRGDDYVCAVKGCGVSDDLTIDHKNPLSRGGTDDLENLQFMCRSHNSSKSNKLADENGEWS